MFSMLLSILITLSLPRKLKWGICPSHHFAVAHGGELLNQNFSFLGLINNSLCMYCFLSCTHIITHTHTCLCNCTVHAQQWKSALFVSNNLGGTITLPSCQNGSKSHGIIYIVGWSKTDQIPSFNFHAVYLPEDMVKFPDKWYWCHKQDIKGIYSFVV